MKDDEPTLHGNTCCICGEVMLSPDLIIEERPSGKSGAPEQWPYCLVCWFNMSQLRKQDLHLEKLFEELKL